MKILSGFNNNHFINKNFAEYFKRPFYSRFLIAQNLQLYSFNSCSPLPNVIANYLYVPVIIEYHLDSLIDTKYDKNYLIEEKDKSDIFNLALNQIKKDFIGLTKIIKISFFYVVDTLIKDSIKSFEDKLDILEEKYNNWGNEEEDLNNSNDNLNEEINTKLGEKCLELIKKFRENFYNHFRDKSYKFILKVAENEEYLYGDYTLGSYNFVRDQVRQYEYIKLILKSIPFYKVQPPLFSFPPILTFIKKNANYINLFDNYIKLYPEREIIYRLFHCDKKQIDRFIHKINKRKEYLNKFTESGDCDFPLSLKIEKLNNIFQFKNWFDDEIYNKNELVLPYFNPLKKLQIKTKGKIAKFCNSIKELFSWKKEEDNQINKEKEKENEKEIFDKLISKHERKKKDNKEIENKINNLEIKSYFEYEKYLLENKSVNTNNIYNEIINKMSSKENNNIKDLDFENDEKKKNKINLNEKAIFFKYKKFKLLKHPESLPIPIFIRIKVYILYGSYTLKKFSTEPFILSDNILINEKIIFDTKNCLISHLPYETRIGITIKAYDNKIDKKFVFGSCQIPLYNENGEMKSGNLTYEIWPNVKIFPRINCNTPFSFKFKKKLNYEGNLILENESDYENKEIIDNLKKHKDKISYDFIEMLNISNEEKKFEDEEIKEREYKVLKKKNDKNYFDGEEEILNLNNLMNLNKNYEELDENKIEYIKDKSLYPTITLNFPTFSSPLIHTIKSPESYRHFLEIQYKHSKSENDENDFDEIRKLFGNSQKEIKYIIKELNTPLKKNSNNTHNNINNNNNNNKYPTDIWIYLKKTLPQIIQILKKDPLEKLEKDQITAILICRDYISTIPSALELFLRAIDWKNPFEVSIAHLYLNKWTPINGEDAVSLLDARFPDIKIREYSINRLREVPDETISCYMLILCQCLIYENFIINPLSDFLIERSLLNPKLIGSSFIWNNRINRANPLFSERLTAYLLMIFTISGSKFLKNNFEAVKLNFYMELMTYNSKEVYKNSPKESKKLNAGNSVIESLKYFNESLFSKKKFTLPIDPTFLGIKFTNDTIVFNSKMVPALLHFYSREPEYIKKVIYKIGDDLRQDVLTIQMLKLMDKLWLNNNLDLKLITYKVCPTEINAGYIECVNEAKELAELQNKSGVDGALDRELIIKYLRLNSSNMDQLNNKTDNFIKSLCGYCVATCVLGVADRHSSNVMIKKNGIFLHIDYGHILGNFKYKFGIKRERSIFLLTPEMANVYINDKKEELFKKMCVKAFNILRKNASKLMNAFIIMSTAGMPEFFGICDIVYMKNMLVLDKPNDEYAGNYFIKQIRKCKNEKFRQIDNIIHNIKQ